jgi:hypothetical protein
MKRLTSESFHELVCVEEDVCLSLLMPTRQAGRDIRENSIRFKNLVDESERLLIQRGLGAPEARDRLRPLADRIEDADFWCHQRQALAVYQTADSLRMFALPRPVDPRVVAARRFHVTPLIPVIDHEDDAYVLALSQNSVRLLHCGADTAESIHVADMPGSFEDIAQYIDDESQVHWHTHAPPIGPGGQRAAVFHGHGAAVDERQHKKWLADFVQRVEAAVTRCLKPEHAPLLLAATEPLAGIYRQINRYDNLLNQTVAGSFDHADAPEIHRMARPILQRLTDQMREQVMARHRHAAGQSKTVDKLPRILTAAANGQIDTLIIDNSAHRWGRWDSAHRRVQIHRKPAPADEDLLNLATVLTAQRKGHVHAVDHERMPGSEPATAVLLY